MALKAILETLDGLDPVIAAEYEEGEDGNFHLNIEGIQEHPAVGALKRAKDHEKKQRKESEGKITKLESELEEVRERLADLDDPGKNKADDKLRAKYEKRIEELEASVEAAREPLLKEIKRLTSGSVALAMANELSTSPDLLLPHIQKRLTTEFVNGKAEVRVLDEDGDIGVLSVKDLEKEIRADKRFAPILKGAKGSGSGSPGKGSGSAQGEKEFKDMTGQERLKLQQENPAEFERLSLAAKKGN